MTTRPNLTTQRLEKLTCPAGTNRIWVGDSTRGLFVLVTAGGVRKPGVKTFYIVRRINGRMARVRIGAWPSELSLEAARRRADVMNGQIAGGEDPREERRTVRGELTLGELWELHLGHAKQRNKSWEQDEGNYRRYLSAWGSKRLSAITTADVQALHSRVGLRGKYSANRSLALLHHMFEKTAKTAGWTGGNPAHGVEKFAEQSRERFLREDELPKFFAALDDEPELFSDFFALCLLTGARRGNVQAMRWVDIDLDRREWTISAEEAKGKRIIVVPLVLEAVDILRQRQADADSEYVFPGRGKTGHLVEPKGAWKRVLARAGLKNLRPHDLRRTLGSWQAAAGVSDLIIGGSLAHRSRATTAIYARLSINPIRQGVEAGVAKMMAAAKAPQT